MSPLKYSTKNCIENLKGFDEKTKKYCRKRKLLLRFFEKTNKNQLKINSRLAAHVLDNVMSQAPILNQQRECQQLFDQQKVH